MENTMTITFKKRKATDLIIIHCSATPDDRDIGAHEIRQMHRERGFIDIGYHYVIRRDGTLEGGRAVNQIGAHCKGHNDRSIGVCLVGGVDFLGNYSANFTDAQMETLRELLDRLKEQYPNADIKGHHDFANKACPSFNVGLWLATGELKVSDKG